MSFDDDVQQNPWTRPGFIAATLVVAIVVVLGIFLATRGSGNENPPPSPTTGGPTASTDPEPEPEPTEPAEAEGDSSVCGLDDVELQGTLTQAPEAEWSLIGTIAAPAVAGAGPGVVEESGLRYCFARTPEGALLAAANMVALGEEPSLREGFIEHSVAAGPGRDAFLEKSRGPQAGGEPVRIQTAGFNLLEYTGDAATVDVAIQTSNDTVGAVAYSLVWEEGDWRVRFRDDGTLWNLPVQLPDLTGYIPWSGV